MSDKILYYGDNLKVLREHVADESVDLVYLDPPFNSNANYNVLFHSEEGVDSQAQIEAFEDTWHWGIEAEEAFQSVLASGNTNAADMLAAMRSFLGENDMMAYLAMMAARLIELHRVLGPTGSLYLHCDPTASHYLKILLDGVFGTTGYRNEISWRRSNPKSLSKINFPNCRDIIFRYTKSVSCTFNKVFSEHDPNYVDKAFKYYDEDGGRYRLLPLLNPNDDRPNLTYEFLGVTRVWRWTKERMQKAYDEGLVVQLKPGAVPQYKLYLDDSKGRTVTNDWSDIKPVASKEALGYPTQKPLSLLERIIEVSSNEGDVILDPFCGCGTTIHAAEKLNRKWIGIDITHLAISLIERRLKDAFPAITFETQGTPRDIGGAKALAAADKYQFQWWALSLVEAQPYGGKKKGADSGIDGIIYFRPERNKTERAIVSVKGGKNIGVQALRELSAVVSREKANIGLLICLAKPTRTMISEAAKAGFYDIEIGRFPRIQILTVEEILAGARPRIPLIDINRGFKRASREDAAKQDELPL